jgi:fumarylacetoacetase
MTDAPRLDETHDVRLKSWVESANSPATDFPIQNLPLGVFRRGDDLPAVGVAIGDRILDLREASEHGLLAGLNDDLRDAVEASTLNALMTLGQGEATALRRRVSSILAADNARRYERLLTPMSEATLLLPVSIGNYSDFYASIHHATNVGRLFRPDNPLLPNYRYVPIAYHGRSSSIVVSGTSIKRPRGQVTGSGEAPEYRLSARLDYEAEVGCFCAAGNALGEPIAIDAAESHLFGLCLVNDWSARDIQAWEYQPLGPFLGKSFGTTISPWVVTYDALAPFRCAAFTRAAGDPPPLAYLSSGWNESHGGFDITVDVLLRTAAMRRNGAEPVRVSRSSLRDLYWTLGQMVTHHTSNGCNLLPGDLIATGTLSGATRDAYGSLLEMTEGGKTPLQLPDRESRTFLEDGDEITMRAFCERAGFARIGFGDCAGVIT